VKAFDAVRRKAGEISAKIYNDQNGDYWYKYYMGVRDPKQGPAAGRLGGLQSRGRCQLLRTGRQA
jgi:hypothetical protein